MSKTDEALAEAYATLPAIACKKLCHGSCGPIAMTREELHAARKLAPVAARPTLGRYYQPRFEEGSLTCSLLEPETKLCRIYAARPSICRLYGLVRKMACPFGCVPERWVSDEEARELIERVERAGQ